MRRILVWGWILCLFAIAGQAIFGQAAPTGTIFGTVTDSAGARLPAVSVTVTSELTGEQHSTMTNGSGDYLFLALPVGSYRVKAVKESFSETVRTGISLDVNQNARVDFQLSVGQVSAQVVISGVEPLVDTRESQVGDVVDSKRVEDLPLNGRNVYSLATLLPGVTLATVDADPNLSEGNQLTINGTRALQTTFLLDGGMNNGTYRNGGLLSPNPDSLEEFRLITSNYNAEYGRSAGGVVDVVTKSGTNQVHGLLYDYFRNTVLNSGSYFTPTVPILKQNQFGGNVGGPIIHDKLFYFFSYQGFRNISAEFVNSALTPTAAERGLVGSSTCPAGSADFSAVPAAIQPKDPNTNIPFPNGCIPATRLDPVAMNALKEIALPNTPSGVVQGSANSTDHDDQYLGKGTYSISPAHQLSVTAFLVRSDVLYPFSSSTMTSNIPGYDPENWSTNQYQVVANETWTIRPSLLNQATFSYINVPYRRASLNSFGWESWGSQYVLGSLPAIPPQFIVTGGREAGSTGDTNELDQDYGIADALSWVHGAHDIKFGGLYNRPVLDYVSSLLGSGTVAVGSSFTGNAFSDFELGRATSFEGSNELSGHIHSVQTAAFAQDDWKATHRLTLNLGLRYEVFTPFSDANGALQQYVPGQQSTRFPSAPLGMVFPGDRGVPAGLVPTIWHNFAPRIGFAADPFGNGKTAIRGGYGIFYSFGFSQQAENNLGQPFQIAVTAFGTPSFVSPFANAGGNPFPAAPGTFVLVISPAWADQHDVPYVEQYNLVVDQQIANNLSFNLAYVGNVSRHLEYERDANQPIYIPGQSTEANVNQRRPIMPGTFGMISEQRTGASANYNALQATLNRRLAHGITFLANYTFSKAIDLESSDNQGPSSVTFEDSNDIALDRAVSTLALKHVFNLSLLAQSPTVNRWGFVGRDVVGGWQLNTLARYSSGEPFTITSGVDSNLNGLNNDRPNLIGNPFLSNSRPLKQRLAEYFNPAAFVAAPTGTDGSVGRDSMYGPGSVDWDTSFFRNFHLYEQHQLQFRAEFFNFFNHPNFSAPTAVLTSSTVGQIRGAAAGRITQFALRYSF